MTPSQNDGPRYDARIQRAKFLAARYPFAAEVLNFYQLLAAFQKQLYSEFSVNPQLAAVRSAPFDSELDLAALLSQFPLFLSLLTRSAPAPIAETARQLALQNPAAWITFFSDFWRVGRHARISDEQAETDSAGALTSFILRAFLQPFAEFLASNASPAQNPADIPNACPVCGSAPLLGVLRPEGDGGKRNLQCSFCLHEWNFRRIFCPACAEDTESKLPVYVAEQFPHVRVEACDTCKFYIRTLDLTKDGHAIPIIDDLAAIPLTLWAHEHNYTRIQPNLLGT